MAFKEIYLTEVKSSIESLELDYEIGDFFDEGHQLVNPADAATDDNIIPLDDLYTKKLVYTNGFDNDFEGWKRYLHVKAEFGASPEDRKVFPTNPYAFSFSNFGGNACDGTDENQAYMHREMVDDNSEISLGHGYLESPRLDNLGSNDDLIVPGDLYELKITTKADPGIPWHFLDVNVASGGSIKPGLSYDYCGGGSDSDGSLISKTNYDRWHSGSLYSTFPKPVKWLVGSGEETEIVEYFNMPARPAEYGGFTLQIGAGISNNDFSKDPEDLVWNGNSTLPALPFSYFDENNLNLNTTHLPSTAPMPQNFGIGLTNSLVNPIYTEWRANALIFSEAPLSLDLHWWNRPLAPGAAQWPNTPTYNRLSKEGQILDTKLKKVELYRITKNPMVLKTVTKKSWKGLPEPISFGNSYEEFRNNLINVVSTLRMNYELRKDTRFLSMRTPSNVQGGTFNQEIGERNVILLKEIIQVPKDGDAYAENLPNWYPRFTFGYSPYSDFVEETRNNIQLFTSNSPVVLNGKQDYFLLDTITNPTGGVEVVNYHDTDNPSDNMKGYLKIQHQENYSQVPYDGNPPGPIAYNIYQDYGSAMQRVFVVNNIKKSTETFSSTEQFVFNDLKGKFNGPYFDWSNENYKKTDIELGYQNAEKTTTLIDDLGSRTVKEKTTFYTDEDDSHLFGKIKENITYDNSNQIISRSSVEYESVLAFEAMHRRLNLAKSESFYDPYKYYYKRNGISEFRPRMENFPNVEDYIIELRDWNKEFLAVGVVGLDSENICPNPDGSCPPNDECFHPLQHPYSVWLCEKPDNPGINLPNNISRACYNDWFAFGSGDPDWTCGNLTANDPFFISLETYNQEYRDWTNRRPDQGNEQGNKYYTPSIKLFSSYGHMGPGIEFYELENGHKIDDTYGPNVLNSYFIKKKKEQTLTYETQCKNVNSKPFSNVTEYEYWDANYAGYATSTDHGYDKLYEGTCVDVTAPTTNEEPLLKGLFYIPSFQLYKTKSYAVEFENDSQEFENFYYWDLANHPDYQMNIDAGNPCFPTLATTDDPNENFNDRRIDYQENYFLWRMINRDNLRILPFESRTTVRKENEATVISSDFFEYSTAWDEEDFPEINVIEHPDPYSNVEDCLNDQTGGVGGSDPINGGKFPGEIFFNNEGFRCVFIRKTTPPAGFECRDDEDLYIWCECELPDATGNGTAGLAFGPTVNLNVPSQPTSQVEYDLGDLHMIHDPYDGPGEIPWHNIRGKIMEVSVIKRLDNPNDPNSVSIPTFETNIDGGRSMSFVFPTNWETITTEKVLKRTNLGLPSIVEDARGIKTKYVYPATDALRFYHCVDNTVHLEQQLYQDNTGKPEQIIIGYERDDAQTYTYSYEDDGKIKEITDPNGVVTSMTYDQLNRPTGASRNGVLLSEMEYSNWKQDVNQSDQLRAQENFTKSTTHLDDNNFIVQQDFIDIFGGPLGSLKSFNNTSQKIVFNNGMSTADGLNFVQRKPHYADFPQRDFSVGVDDKTESRFETDARRRPLQSSKFGINVNGSHVISMEYCYMPKSILQQRLQLAGHSALPDGEDFNATITYDEDGKSAMQVINSKGQLVAQFTGDKFELATVFLYDRLGNVSSTINPENQVTNYLYNHFGLLYQKTSVDDGLTKYAYDKTGLLLAEYNTRGYALIYEYDDYGRMLGQYRTTNKLSDPGAHPVFSGSGFFWLYDPELNAYYDILNIAKELPEKEWRYDEISTNTPSLFNYMGNLYLGSSLTGTVGKIAETTSYDQYGKPIERVVYSYNEDGFPKWEMHKFNYNGIFEGIGLESRIDFAEYGRQGNLITKNVDLHNDRVVDFQYHHEYDNYNRLSKVYAQYENSLDDNLVVSYDYDDLSGLVTFKQFSATAEGCNPQVIDQVTYTYDHQYRMTNQLSKLFSYQLFYDNNFDSQYTDQLTANWNGNINTASSQFLYQNADNSPNTLAEKFVYNYTYDLNNRLTNAKLGALGPQVNGYAPVFGDAAYWFDKIGNLQFTQRGERSPNGQDGIHKLAYYYQNGSNRLSGINHCYANGNSVNNLVNCGLNNYTNLSYDGGGNLRSDSKNLLLSIAYNRHNLPVFLFKPENERGGNEIRNLYNAADSRIFKSEQTYFGTSSTLEYYLRDATGQELGIYDMLKNEWVWYVHGVAREAKTIPPIVDGETGGGGKPGGDGRGLNLRFTGEETVDRLNEAYRDLAKSLQYKGPESIEDPFKIELMVIQLKGSDKVSLLNPTVLGLKPDEYELIEKIEITSPLERFAFELEEGDVLLVQYSALLNLLDPFDNDLDPSFPPGEDPADYPLASDPNAPSPLFSYYIYDHLGNTRVVFRAEGCGKNQPLPTLHMEYAADYYPYGKVLREFTDGPVEKFLTTGHERDKETTYDYRGARFYDADYGRFLSVDPLADAPLNIGTSPYAYVWNNPLKFIDPDGRHGQSHHIDEDGNYLGEVQDGDESVYMHENGTSFNEIGKRIYESPAASQGKWGDTSGGGVQVPGLGVTISAPGDLTSVFEEGLRATASVGFGLTLGVGRVYDTKGNSSLYFDFGITQGLDLSIGIESVGHQNVSHSIFDIHSVEGAGFMTTGSGSYGSPIGLDISKGGDQSKVMLDTKGYPVGRNYKSLGTGLSIGSPIGLTQSSSHTWIYGSRE